MVANNEPASSPDEVPASRPPLIDHLVSGGLKSYAQSPTKVPLAPLTLVFGPNSAGKSSLLSTLTLLRQTVVSDKPYHLRTRGDLADVNTIRQLESLWGSAFPRQTQMPQRGSAQVS